MIINIVGNRLYDMQCNNAIIIIGNEVALSYFDVITKPRKYTKFIYWGIFITLFILNEGFMFLTWLFM